MIGVRADGRKELIALADGYRESAESWADLLRDCARRGMRAPVLAVGDGALGFWNGLREVFHRGSASVFDTTYLGCVQGTYDGILQVFPPPQYPAKRS
jgi:hypothetical protein